jgi:hypothetical protein
MSTPLERMEDKLLELEAEVADLSEFEGQDEGDDVEQEAPETVKIDENYNFFQMDWGPCFQPRPIVVVADQQRNDAERLKELLNCFEPFSNHPYVMVSNPFSSRMNTWLMRNQSKCVYHSGEQLAIIDTTRQGSYLMPVHSLIFKIHDGAYFAKYSSKTGCDEVLVFCKTATQQWGMEAINNFFKIFSKELKEMDVFVEWTRSKANAFDKLILPEDMISDIREDLSYFLKSRRMYKEDLNLPWKRGYMLIGPPGNGKSLLIRCICKYWGLRSMDIRHAIRQDGSLSLSTGTEHKIDTYYFPDEVRPTVFIMEDIDKFVSFQAGEKHRDSASVSLHDVLKGMDGIEEYSDAIVIATTNYPNQLSEALINRPGRFDRIWEIKKPTADNIIKFFKMRGVEFKDSTMETVASDLGEVSMAFVEEFVKSLKMMTKSNSFSKSDIDKVMKRINAHTAYCEKIFGSDGKVIGFGK